MNMQNRNSLLMEGLLGPGSIMLIGSLWQSISEEDIYAMFAIRRIVYR